MNPVRVLRALGPIDLKSIRRDPFLRWLAFYPLLMAVASRWGAPWVAERVAARYALDLTPYYLLVASLLVVMTPALAGVVVGFLLLDQRDDNTLSAIQVTPLRLKGYLAYRVAVPMAVAAVMTVLVLPVAGLVPTPLGPLVATAVAAAPVAPLYALFLGAFASNKVEGFALMKAAGVLAVPPLAAFFVRSAWQTAFGVVPLYWPVKAFWIVHEGGRFFVLHLAVGVAYQLLLVALLLARYDRVLHR